MLLRLLPLFSKSDHVRCHVVRILENRNPLPAIARRLCSTGHESSVYHPLERIVSESHVRSLEEYRRLHELSISKPDDFWGEMARRFFWKKVPEPPLLQFNFDVERGPIDIRWFEGGKTNLCYNALDRNVFERALGSKVAFHWEGNHPDDRRSITYEELLEQVCKFANVLMALGIRRGDSVAIYMPGIIEIVVAMLACVRIGAAHTVVFAGFSDNALSLRLLAMRCSLLVSADGFWRGVRFVDLRQIVDRALDTCEKNGHFLQSIVLDHSKRVASGGSLAREEPRRPHLHPGRTHLSWEELMEGAEKHCAPEWVDACDPLFLLFTSGSMGQPKGLVHSVGGYMVYAGVSHTYVFDHQPDDVHWCTADIGWIMGHTFVVYGPLLNGATSVLFEGNLFVPDPFRAWSIVDQCQVSKFYTAPTAIRTFMQHGEKGLGRCSLESLKILGTAGEPIGPEVWRWYHQFVGRGRCSVLDTYWQTETGGPLLAPLPGATPTKPGSATLPFFGVEASVLRECDGREAATGETGALVLRRPNPGMAMTLHGDHGRFADLYFRSFPGFYSCGDGAYRDADGYFWVTGRTDDMVNVSGHLLSTAEIEGVLTEHPLVAEAAAVSRLHPVKGEALYCFVVPIEGTATRHQEQLLEDLRTLVSRRIGTFAAPDFIQVTGILPKTRSGKIMRRVLRCVVRGDADLGDLSTLEDPAAIDSLVSGLIPR